MWVPVYSTSQAQVGVDLVAAGWAVVRAGMATGLLLQARVFWFMVCRVGLVGVVVGLVGLVAGVGLVVGC